ncbi:transposase family protein [Streptomyces sp. WAC 01325]|uniref:transposase family protein n=1 Tax=Streptomyces sp. WAC 01325 TaxID=2203202 RepID=UPI0021AE72E6|nr:transposase family protein [Streptomyces sp. WAC 01325]
MRCRIPDHRNGRPCLRAHHRPSPRAWAKLADAASLLPAERAGLLARLAAVPDPRRVRGRRHPLVFVLALAACAVLAGARSLAAIAEGAADAPPDLLFRLGVGRSESGIPLPQEGEESFRSAG